MTKTSNNIYDNWESSLHASCEYLSAEDAERLRSLLSEHTDDLRPVYPFYGQVDSDLHGWQLLLTKQNDLLHHTNIPILTVDSFLERAQVRLLFPFLPYKKPYSLPKGQWIRIGQIFTGYGRDGHERGDLIMNTNDGVIAYCEEIPPSEWFHGTNQVHILFGKVFRKLFPKSEARFIPLTNDFHLYLSLYENLGTIGAVDDPVPASSRNTDTLLTKFFHRLHRLFSSTVDNSILFYFFGVALLGGLLFVFSLFAILLGYGDSKMSEWQKGLVLAASILLPLIVIPLRKRFCRLSLETPQTRTKKRNMLYDYLIRREMTRQYLESKTVAVKELRARENFWKILSIYDALICKLNTNDELEAAKILQQGRYHGGKRSEACSAMFRSLEQIADMPVIQSLDLQQIINDLITILKS